MFLREERGQAMVEFALVLPIFLMLICGMIDFGWIFGHSIVLDNYCRDAARYTSVHWKDSSGDNDEQIARARFSTIPGITLSGLDGDGFDIALFGTDQITVSLSGSVELLTPVLGLVLPDPYPITSNFTMRIE